MREAPTAQGRGHIPERMCVRCRRKRPKVELLRIVRTPDGVRYDPRQNRPGRGAYICPEPTCLDAVAARDGQGIRRALRGAPADEVRGALERARADALADESPST